MGHQFIRLLSESKLLTSDIADEAVVAAALDTHRPRRVLNCAGATGSPNVDSCERKPAETYRSNVLGPIILASACRSRGIHFTHLGSGCIYTGDNGGKGFTEDDSANFHGSLYSRTKAQAEAALRDLGALQLRIRMPLSSTPSPRNLLTKLLGYPKIVSVPNSVTILEDFWHPALELMARGEIGVWNMVNDGVETHEALLSLYQSLVDPRHRFEYISESELSSLIVAGRSNCVLDTGKLHAAGLAMPQVETRLPQIVEAYGNHVVRAREASHL